MGIKVSVEKRGNIHLVHDGGQIARYMKVAPPHFDTALGFVVEHPGHIGGAVEAMEKLLLEFNSVRTDANRTRNGAPRNGTNRLPVETLPERKALVVDRTRSGLPLAPKAPVAKTKLALEDLGLKNQQLWRLKAAKITTISKLGMLTEAKLGEKKGIGPAIVKAVKKGLKKHGLRLTSPVG